MYLYGQYCPVARASEILADRWTPLIVRELLAGLRHFNDLDRGLPGISRALLVERLRRLERMGIVERRASADGRAVEYAPTRAGRELQRVIDVLGGWGARWAFGDPRPSELDPVVLLWWMRRRVHRQRLPAGRSVIQFDFRGERSGSYWLVLERTDVSVCLQHPKFDVDVPRERGHRRLLPRMARAHDARRGDARRPRPDRRDARRRARFSALVRLEPHGGRRARRLPRACDGDGVGMSAPVLTRAAAGSA